MAKTLISTHTASASATLDITSGITSSYPVYEFHCVNMHPATNNVNFTFQVNAASGSGFNETIQSTAFRAYLNEGDSGATLAYDTGNDQGNGTAYQQILSTGTGTDNDQSVSGILTIYDPSSTTFAKHFLAKGNGYDHGDWAVTSHNAGYINTTAAIDEISFKFSSGNIDAGVIKMFGVS
jgi:hypothetical protein